MLTLSNLVIIISIIIIVVIIIIINTFLDTKNYKVRNVKNNSKFIESLV